MGRREHAAASPIPTALGCRSRGDQESDTTLDAGRRLANYFFSVSLSPPMAF